jgi:hypothetical protein
MRHVTSKRLSSPSIHLDWSMGTCHDVQYCDMSITWRREAGTARNRSIARGNNYIILCEMNSHVEIS